MNFEFDDDGEKFEAQLRQFRPQAPRPLPGKVVTMRSRRGLQLAILGAAAAVTFAVVLSLNPNKSHPTGPVPVVSQMPAEPVTLGQLRRLTDDPAQLDSQLESLSRVLPDVLRSGGVLSTLAQESR